MKPTFPADGKGQSGGHNPPLRRPVTFGGQRLPPQGAPSSRRYRSQCICAWDEDASEEEGNKENHSGVLNQSPCAGAIRRTGFFLFNAPRRGAPFELNTAREFNPLEAACPAVPCKFFPIFMPQLCPCFQRLERPNLGRNQTHTMHIKETPFMS